MKSRGSLNIFFSNNRKILYIILSIMMLSVLTLTVVYAALSTTLNITGNAEVSAASWDIYLDNVQLNSNSATTNIPTITYKTTASFSTTLSEPGDFYEFTIDVVNNGSIDAMIDSVTKTPDLSDTQKKYLNYTFEYQNGNAITTKQLVSKNSFIRLKVKVEFRKDISVSDLPTTSETLNLEFRVNYVQSDDSGTNVTDNGLIRPKIISGDYDTVGSKVCIGQECFYVISSDEESVTMLAKYNLYAGGMYNGKKWIAYRDEATGIQNSSMLGHVPGQSVINGTIQFSSTSYWFYYDDDNGDIATLKPEYGTNYPTYVYDSNSNIYNYIENYKTYLKYQSIKIEEARLIKTEELKSLGCSIDNRSCDDAPSWIYATSYWSGMASLNIGVWTVLSDGRFERTRYDTNNYVGIRPVIKILKSEF